MQRLVARALPGPVRQRIGIGGRAPGLDLAVVADEAAGRDREVVGEKRQGGIDEFDLAAIDRQRHGPGRHRKLPVAGPVALRHAVHLEVEAAFLPVGGEPEGGLPEPARKRECRGDGRIGPQPGPPAIDPPRAKHHVPALGETRLEVAPVGNRGARSEAAPQEPLTQMGRGFRVVRAETLPFPADTACRIVGAVGDEAGDGYRPFLRAPDPGIDVFGRDGEEFLRQDHRVTLLQGHGIIGKFQIGLINDLGRGIGEGQKDDIARSPRHRLPAEPGDVLGHLPRQTRRGGQCGNLGAGGDIVARPVLGLGLALGGCGEDSEGG